MRERRLQPLAQGQPVEGHPAFRLHVAHQHGVIPLAHQTHRRLLHPGLTAQSRLHFAELDAKAPQLDLIVAPSQIEEAVRPKEAHPIAGAIEAMGGKAQEGGAGQGRLAPVPLAQGRTLDTELAALPLCHRLPRLVQHPVPIAGQAVADGDLPANRRPAHLAHQGPDGGLGRPIAVPQPPGAGTELLGQP